MLKGIGYASGALFGVFLLALLALSLPQSGWKALSVQTGSMVPTFDPGSMVLVHKVAPSSLKVGDIVTYKSPTAGDSITHRITDFQTSNGQRLIIVKGDANTKADAPVTASQIIGKEVKSVPKVGHVIDFAHSPLGLVLLVYLPAALLIIYEIKLMTERLTQLEIERRRTVARETARKIYGGIRPNTQKHTRSFGPTGKALMILALFIGVGFAVTPAYAQLTSNTATLKGTTIKTAPSQEGNNGGGSTQTSCTSNTNVNVSNSSSQTSTSGSASSNNGQASSGNASNSNSSSVNVNVTGC